jgi:cytochrome c oxidase subunit 1
MNDRPVALTIANLWVGVVAFFAAAFLGFYQVLERSGIISALDSAMGYYTSVSIHGVLMAYVFTTFFIMGFGYYIAWSSLKQRIWATPLAWAGFVIALVGTVMAAVPLVLGHASVLYTFYPPMQAHWAFYVGAALLVVGSWSWVLIMIVMTVRWKRANPGQPLPLAMFGNTANATLWIWTSAGVALEVVFQLIPWSLGWVDTVDAGLARTLFSWTLHPIVYFWLIPAYIALYTLVPKQAGGRLFSDEMARIAFIMLLLFGLPIGFHHLYMDPFQAAGWKLLHGFGTFMVAIPTLITGFTVIASLEIAGRMRGGRGLLGWIGALPWGNPMVLAAILALLMLILGGFGGVINASYAMNAMVHNTSWVPAHFHLIFAGTTVIMYFAIGYYLWPKLTGKQLASRPMAVSQLWLWFIGMVILSTAWHVNGLLGEPRRIAWAPYASELVQRWAPFDLLMVLGGAVLLVSGVMFALNLFLTHRHGLAESNLEMEYAEPVHPVLKLPAPLNGFALWNWLLLAYMSVDFGYPILQFFVMKTFDPTAWGI